ncbi:MAG TPA: hypothetical protein PKY50_17220 [Candidatus Competibacter sp.]|nr:hypothetical protein [Candidatus Competibacter sp.]
MSTNTDALRPEEIAIFLERDCGLNRKYIYLLELIPLIEMMWADGKNQEAEIELVHRYAREHLARLQRAAAGQTVLSLAELGDFFARLVHNRPNADLLRKLCDLAKSSAFAFHNADLETRALGRRDVLDRCLQIAIANIHGPAANREQLVTEEKRLLLELMVALGI